ncbi:MAG: hypothetical protein K8T25_10965 [Planctomycetia bacterium]|nr:hypothetical protein [Planctomycetia bacterium]
MSISNSSVPRATHDFQSGDVTAAIDFLKRTRNELRTIRKVRVYVDRVEVIDVNNDFFEIRGLGYPDADVLPILQNVNAAFNPETIQAPTADQYKEFGAGRRYTWAQDRVM